MCLKPFLAATCMAALHIFFAYFKLIFLAAGQTLKRRQLSKPINSLFMSYPDMNLQPERLPLKAHLKVEKDHTIPVC